MPVGKNAKGDWVGPSASPLPNCPLPRSETAKKADSEERQREIKRLEAELAALKEADREHPDKDTSIVFVLVRQPTSGKKAFFDRGTVSPIASGCFQKQAYQDAEAPEYAMENPVVQISKVRMTEIETRRLERRT